MWRFRRNRNPWGEIGEKLMSFIDYIDSKAVGELEKQGEDDKALQARLIAIRLASMLKDPQITKEMVLQAEQLLDTQTTAGMTALQSNGHGEKKRDEERLLLEARSQVFRCYIQNAAVRSI